MDIFHDWFQGIVVTITSFFIVVSSILPWRATDINKPIDTSIASPSATISASASATPTSKPVIKRVATPRPSPTPTPSPQPSRVAVLLVNDGTTVYCLSEWADEVKRASQGVKDAEEGVNKSSDCRNSCMNSFETAKNDCNAKFPNLAKCISLFSSFPKDSSWADCTSQYPSFGSGSAPPEYTEYKTCANKVGNDRSDCLNSCPSSGPSSGLDDLYSNREKSKKFLQETKGEHCTDSM